jgi:hypothetical protein
VGTIFAIANRNSQGVLIDTSRSAG